MQVENIKTIHRSYDSYDLTRSYVTMIDSSNKRVLSIVEQTFTPYDKRGTVESAQDHKGTKFDIKA